MVEVTQHHLLCLQLQEQHLEIVDMDLLENLQHLQHLLKGKRPHWVPLLRLYRLINLHISKHHSHQLCRTHYIQFIRLMVNFLHLLVGQ